MTGAACGLALVLAIDVSGSISDEHFRLQRDATAAALTAPAVIHAARDGLAVSAMMWGSDQHVVLPWRVLTGAAGAEDAARALRGVARPEAASTDVARALLRAVALLRLAPCEAERRIIDISGDGRHVGPADEVRDAVAMAVAEGVEVNALPIVTRFEPQIADWYRDNVASPAGGFVVPATPEGFARAIRLKISMEVAGR